MQQHSLTVTLTPTITLGVKIHSEQLYVIMKTTWILAAHSYSSANVDSAFYPLWDSKMSISFWAECYYMAMVGVDASSLMADSCVTMTEPQTFS